MGTEAAQIVDQMEAKPTPAPQPTTQVLAPEQVAKPEDRVSSKIDILIKREREALARERQAKQKETELEEKIRRIQQFDEVRTNPKKALELLGLDYDQLTQAILNDGQLPPDVQYKKLEDKFDSFRSAQEEVEKKRQEEAVKRAQAQEEQAITNFKSEINQYLDDNKARYELINFEGGQELVYEVIDEHYTRTMKAHQKELAELGEDLSSAVGKVLSITEAADKVELYMEQKYHKAKDLNKTKTLWGAVPQGLVKEAAKAESKPHQKPNTLTNNLSAGQTIQRKAPLSDDERVQLAIAKGKAYLEGRRT